MGSHIQKLKILFFTVLTLLIFSACSNAAPSVTIVHPSMIFEYQNGEELPQARLSIFFETTDNVRTYERMTLTCTQNKYVWNMDNLVRFESSEKKMVGYTNLVTPPGQDFPVAKYNLEIENSAGDLVQKEFQLAYDISYCKMPEKDVPQYIMVRGGRKQIIIYDQEGAVLFYGDKTAEYSNNRSIWARYPKAKIYRDIWITPDASIICIMPETEVTPE